MNFFESQAKARRNTFQLVFLFLLAVFSIIILTNLIVMAFLGFFKNPAIKDLDSLLQHMDWWRFGMVGLGVWVVVLAGSVSKILALSGGGKVIAEAMGGQQVIRNTGDIKQLRLLNIVEEMAIASGTPVPPVYIMQQERAMNAFAAGYSARDAVISVTQGLLDHLNREQLQGVIAHEFSHIFNGDMRLNIQLTGTLNGILIIGMIGYEMMTLPFRGSRHRGRSGGSGDAKLLFFLVSAGLSLMIVGYTGTFFGNMIKAAVSRQREYLADASAVQYTRNPQGLAGALKRIGGLTSGSRLQAPQAVEISHAFFAKGVSGLMQSLFATHPPLVKRIRRIDPYWNGHFYSKDKPDNDIDQKTQSQSISSISSSSSTQADSSNIEQLISGSGQLTQQAIEQARELIAAMPSLIRQSASEPYSARAVIYALLLDGDYPVRVKQLEHLQYHADRDIYLLTQKIMNEINAVDVRLRLPLLDISIPVLKQLSNKQYQLFRENVIALMNADGKVDLMEWTLQKILLNHLDQHFYNFPKRKTQNTNLKQLQAEIAVVLSLMSIAGHAEIEQARFAFNTAMSHLRLDGLKLLGQKKIKVKEIDEALNKLQTMQFMDRVTLLEACILCIEYDKTTSAKEIEIMRAFSSAIDCPIPLVIQT